ncbi:MAG: methyltransferase domain-containing protein [Trueperaceae bacterium]
MADSLLQDQVAAARAYEALHIPALFGQWATPVLDAVGVKAGDRVLDVACGTGVLGRTALDRVGGGGSVAGIDPDPGMIAVASEITPAVEWRLGLAEDLPYPDAAFDTVVSQFGMMFFRDRGRAVREMLRVVPEGGSVAVAVWDGLDNTEAYPEAVDLLARMAGRDAADALQAPFVLGDADALAKLFEDSDADSVAVTTRRGTARFPSVRAMVEADLRGWLPVMGVVLDEDLIRAILDEAEDELDAYVKADGTVAFDVPAHIVTGTRGPRGGI